MAQEIDRGRMDILETQETLSTRDRTWKNRQFRDTGNIKHKRLNVEEWTIL
jgi:hypothetical protein